jgi:hypothetical protein
LLQALGDLRQLPLQQQVEALAVVAAHGLRQIAEDCSAIAAGS